jgi:ABC-2 family transporter protein
MAWVTWRQHRLQLMVGLGFLAALALAAVITGLPVRSAYHRETLSSCLPPTTRSGCDLIVRHFEAQFSDGLRIVRYLAFIPVLAGVFVGAPLLAREYEQGTFRLAWTQAVTRRRWLVSKTALLGVAALLGGVALGAIAMWWRHPFDTFQGRMSPSEFDIEGLVVPAYALFALAVGIFAGALLRHLVPAMCAALGAFVGTRLLVTKFIRPHYMAPRHESAAGLAPSGHGHDWVLHNTLVDAAGARITTGREDVAILHAQHAGIPAPDYLLSLGWRRAVTFQPGDRFWTFQAIEAGAFVLLALALGVASVWLVQRRRV